LRLPAYIAGGVGALGLVGFVAFGVMGKSQENDLRDRGCAPNCPKEDVDSAKTKYLLADISLGVGIVGIGAGVTLFILSMPKSDKPSDEAVLGPHFDFAPVRGGGYATMSGRF
jgi:hypothetical protein